MQLLKIGTSGFPFFFFSRFCFLVAYNIYVENIQDTIETVTVSPSPAIRAVILKN